MLFLELEIQEEEYIRKLQVAQHKQDEILSTLETILISATPSLSTTNQQQYRKNSTSQSVPQSNFNYQVDLSFNEDQQKIRRKSEDETRITHMESLNGNTPIQPNQPKPSNILKPAIKGRHLH